MLIVGASSNGRRSGCEVGASFERGRVPDILAGAVRPCRGEGNTLVTTGSVRSPGGGVWKVVGNNAASKVLVLGLSGAFAIVTTRLIIQHFGIDAYAQYGLLASMSSLVPFADLGMSAAIINTVASAGTPQSDDNVRRTLVSALRVLFVSGAALIAIGALFTLLGLWPDLLGEGLNPSGGSTAAFLCVMIFGLTLPMGVGQRVLTGLGKNHVQIRAQALVAPAFLVAVGIFVALQLPAGNYLAVASYAANALLAVVSLYLAAKLLRPQLRSALSAVPKLRTVRGVSVMNVAWPMLAQMLALPIAMQTDRLLLSHLTGTTELSQYNLASQLFGMIIQTISAAGVALWPVFAKARSDANVRSPYTLTAGFFGGGLFLAAVLALLSPWLTGIVSDGRIDLDAWLVWGFVAFVGAQAAKYPLGMYMTDLRGLRFQVLPIFILVPVNLGLSWMLIGVVGPGGPIMGSAIAVTLCQVLPNLWYVRRDLARRRAIEPTASGT